MARLFTLASLAILGFFLISIPAFSQTTDLAERFSDFDPNSTFRINHKPLSDYLDATVFPVGRSYRILGNEKADSYRGSRIKTSKPLSPSRFEGSRLFISAFSEDHKAFFRSYQEGLERLSIRRPLKEFNQAEQIAFWLNLYNVIVINKIIEEYPIQNLKSLRSTKRGKKSFWSEKVTTIEGVPLSLLDIEHILFTNFDTPEIAFGLWQGSIGGPRLRNFAYTGSNVKRALENNAMEFVNSNRGLRPPKGSRVSVSKFYEWALPAFGTSADHVLQFIKKYSDPNFVDGVQSVTSLSFKIYEWQIADIMGGTKHTGQHTQMGGVLTAGANQPDDGSGIKVGNDLMGLINAFMDTQPVGGTPGIPLHVNDLFFGIRQNTRQPIPIITTEECAPGDECNIEDIDEDGGF